MDCVLPSSQKNSCQPYIYITGGFRKRNRGDPASLPKRLRAGNKRFPSCISDERNQNLGDSSLGHGRERGSRARAGADDDFERHVQFFAIPEFIEGSEDFRFGLSQFLWRELIY